MNIKNKIHYLHSLIFTVILTSTPLPSVKAGNNFSTIHHTLDITLDPDSHSITVSDTIKLAEHAHYIVSIKLNSHLSLGTNDQNIISIEKLPGRIKNQSNTQANEPAPTSNYLITLKDASKDFTLNYEGIINHRPEKPGNENSRGMKSTTGIIDREGVFLAHSSHWYPVFPGNNFVAFDMTVHLPENWKAVSQGNRVITENGPGNTLSQWKEDNPQDDIYLIAAPFREYTQDSGNVRSVVFFRNEDDKLAQKYLDATGQYIDMYNRLLGPYPYKKFALVENFWETGYGMPSFTLLGSTIIKFPFIIVTSYPHEILHNWWGNSVYVDYTTGNWAEGLTAYLADHLLKEQRGNSAQYRRGLLQKYTDYVDSGDDFPLTEFRSRHDAESEAVGYGKTAMFFHMLRMKLGDEQFVKSLREFYKQYKFNVAGYKDLQAVFGEQSQQNLSGFFNQWIKRTGAPILEINTVNSKPVGNAYELSVTIKQLQDKPFSLLIPVRVWMTQETQAYDTQVTLTDKQQSYLIPLPSQPWKVDIDPEFDVFRRLDSREIPSALSQGFGAKRPLLILPDNDSDEPSGKRFNTYKKLARQWKNSQSDEFEIITDSSIKTIPNDRTVWIVGWKNRFRNTINKSITGEKVSVQDNGLTIGKQTFSRQKHALVVTGRNPDNDEHTLLWVASDNINAIPGLARKLPHYGKYSYLVFDGDAPTNIAKGQWDVNQSPMSVRLFEHTAEITSEKRLRQPLITLPPVFSKDNMLKDIRQLVSKELQGQKSGDTQSDKAADYIAGQFRDAGLSPAGDTNSSWFQAWRENPGGKKDKVNLKNVVAVLPGVNPKLAGESLVISAHYDPHGLNPYGADDNASGVAVMLELARQIARKWKPERSIIFVAFTAKDSPRSGSAHYIKTARQYPASKISTVLNLDTVGKLGKQPLKILGAESASELVHVFRGVGYVTGVKIKQVNQDVETSDQHLFLKQSIPAVQFFAGAHDDLHQQTDTLDKIDSHGLVKIATVLKESAEYLANRIEPLTIILK